MFKLLNTIYVKLEQIKGPKLIILLISIFVLFLAFGLGLGYFTNNLLNKSEHVNVVNTATDTVEDTYLEGRVAYVNPNLYPGENISFVLVDGNGNEVMLLKSNDQKLVVTEGHNVKVKGKMSNTESGSKEVLLVSEIIIQNGTN